MSLQSKFQFSQEPSFYILPLAELVEQETEGDNHESKGNAGSNVANHAQKKLLYIISQLHKYVHTCTVG